MLKYVVKRSDDLYLGCNGVRHLVSDLNDAKLFDTPNEARDATYDFLDHVIDTAETHKPLRTLTVNITREIV